MSDENEKSHGDAEEATENDVILSDDGAKTSGDAEAPASGDGAETASDPA